MLHACHLPAVATTNLYAALLLEASSSTSRKVAAECVKKLDAFMERSGEPKLGHCCCLAGAKD